MRTMQKTVKMKIAFLDKLKIPLDSILKDKDGVRAKVIYRLTKFLVF
jgi:hypothetical protein